MRRNGAFRGFFNVCKYMKHFFIKQNILKVFFYTSKRVFLGEWSLCLTPEKTLLCLPNSQTTKGFFGFNLSEALT